MDIKIQSLVSLEQLKTDADKVLNVVDSTGQAIVLKENKPAYIIVKYTENGLVEMEKLVTEKSVQSYSPLKLHEAIVKVLEEQPEKQMHASVLADEIYKRNLYRKKDGNKAQANQIRSRSENYKDIFRTLPGNIIKLRLD